MPSTATARGLSALAGFGLFLTAIVLCFQETTTSGFLSSTMILVAVIVTGLGMAAKWAIALGVENKLAVYGDKIASFLPWVALVSNGFQVVQYKSDGPAGFFACLAALALTFIVAFGLTDSIASLVGKKFHDLQEAAAMASNRLSAMSEAAHGRR